MDTTDTSVIDTGGTVDTTVPTGPMALYAVTGTGIPSRIWQTGTTDPCELNIDGTVEGYQTMDCTLDIPELDLFGYGLDFDFTVPFGACDFVTYHHYMYEAWEVGTGPTDVSYDVDAVGNITNEVNSVNGVPACQYDYSRLNTDAPNCCVGNYTLSVTNTDSGVTRVVGPISWGGKPSTCYGGAAYIDPEATFTADGWPTGKIVFTNQTKYDKRFHWDELSTRFISNVPLANHYDPADHDGTMPAGLAGEAASPYYVFRCYDHAEELLGQIRLEVREWNEESEYYANGDPDTTGTEPVSGEPIDDRNDWATATPGSTDFIQDAQ